MFLIATASTTGMAGDSTAAAWMTAATRSRMTAAARRNGPAFNTAAAGRAGLHRGMRTRESAETGRADMPADIGAHGGPRGNRMHLDRRSRRDLNLAGFNGCAHGGPRRNGMHLD